MCFFVSLMPATILVVIGYFVLDFSTKALGALHRFGRGLAIWIFFLALFFPMMGAYVTISDQCPMEKMIEQLEKATDH
jgi:hypothetical protein